MSIPIQTACDPDKPEEHVLWALVGIAGPQANAPLVMPVEVMRQWSEHLHKCGYRHHPELQEIKYIPPCDNTNWFMGASGQWVPIDTPLPAEVTAPSLDGLTLAEKQVLLQRLTGELTPNVLDDTTIDRARVE